MKIPIGWLKEYVDFHDSIEGLANRLTFAGLEMESISAGAGEASAEETVIELEITPNRTDCLSLIGIARETAMLYGTNLKLPQCSPIETAENTGNQMAVQVENQKKCPRYTLRILKKAVVAPSPEWMQRRLEHAGLRPVCNVVDITNYVMLETGHPLHAFDRTAFTGSQIVVRTAKPGETLKTLDGAERRLTEEMLVIADGEKAAAIAGVMGGAESEIKADTSTILLEAAAFESSTIRHTAKTLGLTTDASYRFQRGVNAGSVEWAGRRAAALLCELAGAELCRGVVDFYPKPEKQTRIPFSWKRIEALLGTEIPSGRMEQAFRTLQIGIEKHDGETTAIVPDFRPDIQREIDLAGETVRIYGVNNIPAQTPSAKVVPGAEDTRTEAVSNIRNVLQGLGAGEIMNYTLVSHSLLDLFNKENRSEREELPHPVSIEQSVMRTSLIPQMVESLGRNHSRQINEACFYEIGRIFNRVKEVPVQDETVSLGMMGPVGRAPLEKRAPVSEEEMFLWMKGLIEQLIGAQKSGPVSFQTEARREFEAGSSLAVVIAGQTAGSMGLINRTACAEWRLTGPAAAAELRLEALLRNASRVPQAKEFASFPSINRDLAMVLDESIQHKDVAQLVKKAGPDNLERFELFDVYRGKSIGKGKKSLAYTFIYRSAVQTLTDLKINETHQILSGFLCRELGGRLRELK